MGWLAVVEPWEASWVIADLKTFLNLSNRRQHRDKTTNHLLIIETATMQLTKKKEMVEVGTITLITLAIGHSKGRA